MNNIFFYSEKCQYCKEAYDLIKTIGLDKFIFKDIDKEDVPDIVDRVPTVLRSENNKIMVYCEENLFKYLNEMLNIEPFMINEMGGISDKYSYMDNSGVNLDHAYQFLDKESTIITPTESDTNKIINYDKFIADRDNDIQITNTDLNIIPNNNT